jgi:site-specific DNA-methyltransferase (adenine-specific)
MPKAKSVEWGTPQEFFDQLNEEFDFTLDPCASHENTKCERYFTKAEDGLAQSWAGERVFMNPPYGTEAANWIAKAYFESQYAEVIVGLLPARTDTRWFHDFVNQKAEVRFVKGRLKFEGQDGKTGTATFPSIVVVWRNNGRSLRTARAARYLNEQEAA